MLATTWACPSDVRANAIWRIPRKGVSARAANDGPLEALMHCRCTAAGQMSYCSYRIAKLLSIALHLAPNAPEPA